MKMEFDLEERIRRASDNFMNGYNCSQAVFMAYYDLVKMDKTIAEKVVLGLGGGVGGSGEICGTLSSMSLFGGFAVNSTEPDYKSLVYAKVKHNVDEFGKTFGGVQCRYLKSASETRMENTPAAEREKKYYNNRVCIEYVVEAARRVGKMLLGE